MIVLGRREASKAEVNIMANFMAKVEYSTKIVFFQYVLNTSVSATKSSICNITKKDQKNRRDFAHFRAPNSSQRRAFGERGGA